MEYDAFSEFVKSSPQVAFKMCHQKIKRLIEYSVSEGEEVMIQQECDSTLEVLQLKKTMKDLVIKGCTMPTGMDAYHKGLHTFIRWLPGHNRPISGGFKNVLAQQKE